MDRPTSSSRVPAPPVDAERVRLFVALELPEEIRAALAEWRASVLDLGSQLRLVPVEALLEFVNAHRGGERG